MKKRNIATVILCAAVLTACSQTEKAPEQRETETSATNKKESSAENSEEEMKTSVSGQTITVYYADNPDVVDPIKDKVGEFEEATGIKVNIETVPESESRTKAPLIHASKSTEYDVFVEATNGFAGSVKAGWYDPVDNYLPEDFDLDDFPNAMLELMTADGHLYGLPIRSETNIMMYRKDVFEELGIEVPQTLDEYRAAAEKMTRDTNGDGKIDFYGTAHRGDPGQSAYSFTYFLKSMGGHFLNSEMKADMTSQEAKQALELYCELNQRFAPPGGIVYTWDQVFGGIQNGTVGMIIDSSIQAGILEDPNKSTTVGKIGYAVPPKGAAGSKPDLKCYGYYISAYSLKKEAASQFIQWATGVELQKYAFDKYGVAALTRNSVLDYASNKAPYFQAIKEAMKVGDIYYLPLIPECDGIYGATGEAVSAALAGTKGIEEALEEANIKIQKMIDDAGYTEIPEFIRDGKG